MLIGAIGLNSLGGLLCEVEVRVLGLRCWEAVFVG